MTNYEKRKAEIEPITRMGRQVAIERNTNKIRPCRGMRCENCLFYDDTTDCNLIAMEWADAEYIEPQVDWSKVAVDTPILVRDSNDGKWVKRHFAKYQNEEVYAFADGGTSWSEGKHCTRWNYAKLAEIKE